MQSDGTEKVGVIGLGIIGNQVAAQLRETGRHVYVWNRTPKSEPNFVSSPMEIAKLSEVIHLFVSDGGALLEVVTAMKSELCQRHTIVSNCTADPESVIRAYQIVKETGASFLDAPFTGSKVAAGDGALVYYIGGDLAVLEKVTPVLEASSKEILFLGQVGEATILKIATNMITAATVEVLSEAYGLITAAGIGADKLEQAIKHNACGSAVTGMKLPAIIERDYEPHFTLKNMFKDAKYALGLGKSLGVEMPALSTTANIMFRSMKKELGEKDFSVIAARFQEFEKDKATQ